MTHDQIITELNSPKYDFLKNDEKLKNKMCAYYLAGSLAHNTNLPDSGDLDLRGCYFDTPHELVMNNGDGIDTKGGTYERHIVEDDVDTSLYRFTKFIGLLLKNNPSVIECLGLKDEHYFYETKPFRIIRENAFKFITTACIYTFAHYATAQNDRIENAQSHYTEEEMQEKHLARSLGRVLSGFLEKHPLVIAKDVKCYADKSYREGKNFEVYADFNIEHIPVRELKALLNEFANVPKQFDKLGSRNTKKTPEKMNKHAMELFMLYLQLQDIVEKKQIITFRPERDFLLSIRNGFFMNPDGTYNSSYFDMIRDWENKLKYWEKNNDLPRYPDKEWILDFKADVAKDILDGKVYEKI